MTYLSSAWQLIKTRPWPLRILITGRLTVAASFLFVPRFMFRVFQMPAERTPAPAFARMFGIRNAILAVGLIHLEKIATPRGFVWANVLADVVDALAFISAKARGEISGKATFLTASVALCAAALGAAAQVSPLAKGPGLS